MPAHILTLKRDSRQEREGEGYKERNSIMINQPLQSSPLDIMSPHKSSKVKERERKDLLLTERSLYIVQISLSHSLFASLPAYIFQQSANDDMCCVIAVRH